MAFTDLFRRRRQPQPSDRPLARARFEAAERGDDYRHWAGADAFSADKALSPEKRRVMRNRARFERANNSYLAGISATLAYDLVGTGPRLQLDIGASEAAREVEEAFYDWGTLVDLPAKLRTMREALVTDGEAFALMINNPRLPGVQLDLRLLEAEMVATPTELMRQTIDAEGNTVDGLEFDDVGNVIAYQVLNFHPGSNYRVNNLQFQRVPANQMVHWLRVQRPGQNRGMPEVAPALRLFGQLRRYTEAVIAAAETAADFAAVLFTDAPANGEAQALEPMDVVELEKRMATVLPDGWRLGQIEAQQPATGYAEFKREILNEIARCLNLPYNIAACNSSGYNYASGRLDHQTYYKSIRVEQAHLAEAVLDRIFAVWIDEAMLTSELAVLRSVRGVPHQWFFDGTEHVDPAKEANAQAIRLASNTTTLAAEYARQGKDWEVELHQRAKEVTLMAELGLTDGQVQPIEDDEESEADRAVA